MMDMEASGLTTTIAKRFGWILRGEETGADPLCDVPVRSTPEAVAIPTIGAIVPNWLLAVPRSCASCVAELAPGERLRLLRFSQQLANEMRDAGEPVFFEHGARESNHIVGCGVDQAHLHVLATRIDILAAALADTEVTWTAVDTFDPWRHLDQSEYYFIQAASKAFVGRPHTSQSQYFRKLIAQAAGVPLQWDYRVWPNYENVKLTYGRFNGRGAYAAEA
jgi:ATP adenylyltransferase